ncbi:phosphoesterase [Chimaeribacter californicus]|uniref:Phosphoesterase n=1 Tax=Chimaeribacter californicus TaxID=2060067 RepID=A0A2N5E6Y6_9GAMM|nr:phosphatase PAP2 family protein [Chimaeribacter californicus]PLR37250.1 phosphoesterase [Chimaeribacter californicus]
MSPDVVVKFSLPRAADLNRASTAPAIKIFPLYSLSRRFYCSQVFGLLISGLLFFWLSRHEQFDLSLSQPWFDPLSGHFPLQENYWLNLINHRLLKQAIIAGAVCGLLWGVIRREPRVVLVMLLFAVGPLVVGVLKATSAHSCPWDLQAFGGQAQGYPLLGAVPLNAGPGRCFPGGHASSGFCVMALFFLFYPQRRQLAWACWLAGIVLGLVMGYGQVMRGAHFFTHNLWAGWWVWVGQLAVFGWSDSYRRYRVRKT